MCVYVCAFFIETSIEHFPEFNEFQIWSVQSINNMYVAILHVTTTTCNSFIFRTEYENIPI